MGNGSRWNRIVPAQQQQQAIIYVFTTDICRPTLKLPSRRSTTKTLM